MFYWSFHNNKQQSTHISSACPISRTWPIGKVLQNNHSKKTNIKVFSKFFIIWSLKLSIFRIKKCKIGTTLIVLLGCFYFMFSLFYLLSDMINVCYFPYLHTLQIKSFINSHRNSVTDVLCSLFVIRRILSFSRSIL